MKSAVIATHSFSPGTSQALYSYMQRHNYDVLFIEHKLFGSPVTWLLDAIDTFWKVLVKPKKYDLFVGSNRLNAFVGILLKWIGKVKKVVYFSPDWVTNRLSIPFLNYLYQSLDYFCVKYSDITWNSSTYMDVDFMMQERLKLGYPKGLLKKQTQVPDGTDPYPILPFEKINKTKLGYVGHLIDATGIDLVIDSYQEIAKKIPSIEIIIIGSGDSEQRFRDKAKGMNITFTGFIGDINKVYKLLEDCAVALAPYQPGTISQFTDPGKVKNYLSIGLPVIITTVPEIAKELHEKKCGIAIPYEKESLINAVTSLLSNEELLSQYRDNTKEMAQKYSWDNIFNKALINL